MTLIIMEAAEGVSARELVYMDDLICLAVIEQRLHEKIVNWKPCKGLKMNARCLYKFV